MRIKSGVFDELDNADLGACAHFSYNLLPTNVTNCPHNY